jgi:hypothetical protein
MVYRLWVIAGVLGLGGPAWGATLDLTVVDDAGRPVAFRVQAFQAGRMVAQAWERERARLPLPAGKQTILVRHGFDYDAVSMELDPGREVIEKRVTLQKRYDVKGLGWYCGESHLHGQHGRSDKPQSFADAARLAEANGLDYIQIAQWWTPDFGWPPLERLQAMAREAGTPRVAVHWNMESPKCYFTADDGGAGGNLHCYGHGCIVGMEERPYDRAFWFTGPNFRILQEIHRQGAVVTLAHPARFWFNRGNFVSNWASEIAFDYVAGQGYDGVDIFNDGEPVFFQHERVWWNLLNMGYKVAGTANSDGSIIEGHAGRFRTYTHIDGGFSWAKIAQGIRAGACVASSGPMVLFEVDGQRPGAEFPADGRPHRARLTAWSSPLPGETLVSAQVLRNGEIVQAWDLRSRRARRWSGQFELGDTAFAWYAIRVTSTCQDPACLAAWRQPAEIYEVAVASPVYFLPKGFQRPRPAVAKVRLKVTDPQGKPLAATVHVTDAGREVAQVPVGSGGQATFQAPPTAALTIRAPGYAEVKKDLFLDSPVLEFCRNFNGFYTPGGFHDMRDLLGNLEFEVQLKRSGERGAGSRERGAGGA